MRPPRGKFEDHNSMVRYKRVSHWSVACLLAGLASWTVVFGWWWSIVSLAALAFGWFGFSQLTNSPRDLTGGRFVVVGVTSAIVLWFAGVGYLLLKSVQEVPWGYTVMEYEDFQPKAGEPVSETALMMEGERVFIKGYILHANKARGIRRFELVPTAKQGAFPRDPSNTEMVTVQLTGDLSAHFRPGMLYRVGGIFHVRKDAGNDIPYQLDADYLQNPPKLSRGHHH